MNTYTQSKFFAHLANDKNWAQLREYKLLSKSKNVSNKN
jgi:hypothetical protein